MKIKKNKKVMSKISKIKEKKIIFLRKQKIISSIQNQIKIILQEK